MDKQTNQIYNEKAAEFAERYDSCSGGISDHFAAAFPSSSRILDVGCGSGRDLRILHDMKFQADGVDPCEEFVNRINTESRTHGVTDLPSCVPPLRDYGGQTDSHGLTTLEHSRTSAILDSLPELATIADDAYDGVLCSAVLMHLPEEQLFDASFAIRRVLKPKGRLLLSIPLYDKTIDSVTKRDTDGRLFNGLIPEELQLLFERIGFKLLNRWESPDSLNRDHRKWVAMLLELESATGNRPIDTIESILNKDAKVATYKLALFRSLANIATTNYKMAKWTNDGRVKIPTQVLAEKWIEYYWPLVEADIKQTTGDAIAFRKQLEELVDYFRSRGGLSAFVLQYRNNKLSIEAGKICKKVISKLKGTIWNQPVRYAGVGGDFSVFQYDKSDQTVLIGNEIWKELSLMGSWIQDATILRWAELSAKFAKSEIKPSAVIDCLLTVPIQEREVNAAKSFYDALDIKECVWSGKTINDKYNLDHAIPFSLWKNNYLWNLLPADAKVNGNKKDKLPANRVVKARKDCIVHYWSLINREFPARFEYEAGKLMGNRLFDNANWENRLFATFAEAVEITAIQRGVERWEPASFAATGTENSYVQKKRDVSPLVMDVKAEYNSVQSKIIKIVSGGQTGADRGGLDAAIALEIAHGGWCPKGRFAEDGVIPEQYELEECGSKSYPRRTELNVKDSDATVIFTLGTPTGGSKKTAEFAEKHGKPCLIVDSNGARKEAVQTVTKWLRDVTSQVSREPSLFPVEDSGLILNVAGSRGSKAPDLRDFVQSVMVDALREINALETPKQLITHFTYNEIAGEAFKGYLPFAGEVAAGIPMHELEELYQFSEEAFTNDKIPKEMSSIDLDWIPSPRRHAKPRCFIVRISGDSMEPKCSIGDYVICEYHRHFQPGREVVIMANFSDLPESGECAIKRISETRDFWIFASDNKAYDDIKVSKDDMNPEFPIFGVVIYNLSKKIDIT